MTTSPSTSIEKKCDVGKCTRQVTWKATFTDKKTGEIDIAYYCDRNRMEAYDLEGLSCIVNMEMLS